MAFCGARFSAGSSVCLGVRACYFYLFVCQPLTLMLWPETFFGIYSVCVCACFQLWWSLLLFPEPSAGVGRRDGRRRRLRGHPASRARPVLRKRYRGEPMLWFRAVPNLQGPTTEGRHPGPACKSPPRLWLPGTGLQQDLPLHVQNLHQPHEAHRATLSEVPMLVVHAKLAVVLLEYLFFCCFHLMKQWPSASFDVIISSLQVLIIQRLTTTAIMHRKVLDCG